MALLLQISSGRPLADEALPLRLAPTSYNKPSAPQQRPGMQPGEMTPEAFAALQQQQAQQMGAPAPGIAQPNPAAASFWGARRAATFDHLNRLDAAGEPCRSLYILPGRSFGEAEALALACELTPNDSLEELYASGHSLGLPGAEALGAAIAVRFGPLSGALFARFPHFLTDLLAKSGQQHPTLRVLCLGDEKFGEHTSKHPFDCVSERLLLDEQAPMVRTARPRRRCSRSPAGCRRTPRCSRWMLSGRASARRRSRRCAI